MGKYLKRWPDRKFAVKSDGKAHEMKEDEHKRKQEIVSGSLGL